MNILIVTCTLPWPLLSGGHVSQFSTLKALSKDHRVRIVLTSYSSFSTAAAKLLESKIPSVEVVRPKVAKLVRNDININRFGPISFNRLKASVKKAIHYGFKKYRKPKELVESGCRFSRAYFPFKRLPEDVISCIYDNLQWADLIQAEFHESLFVGFLPVRDIPKVFVCHQAHNIYTKTFYSDMNGTEFLKDSIFEFVAESDRLAALNLECAAMSSFDRVIVFSESDKQSLLPICTSPVIISPFPLPADVRLIKPEKSGMATTKLVFIGPGYWHPNVDAINWFYHNVLIDLVGILGISTPVLHVVGRWEVEHSLAYDSSLVCFHGYIEDVSSILKGAITINPVFTGAGLRTKLLAAAASSSPIISTTHGAEGSGLTHGKDCLLADSAECFANSITTLLQDTDLAYQIALNAFNHVSSHFSAEAVRISRNNIYNSMCSRLQG